MSSSESRTVGTAKGCRAGTAERIKMDEIYCYICLLDRPHGRVESARVFIGGTGVCIEHVRRIANTEILSIEER